MKKIIVALTAIALASAANAQETPQEEPSKASHYIVMDFGGGFNNLVYSLDNHGKREPGMGIMGRLGYRYFFTPHWGWGANVVYKQSKTEAKMDYNDSYNLTDEENENYNFIVRYNSLKESQKQTSIAIPLGIYFQGQMTEKWKIGFGLGVSAQFVNDESMKTVSGDLSTEAYYPKDDITFKDMENHGFYTQNDFEGSYDYKTAFGAFGEINFIYALSRCIDFTAGIYGGYGLTKSTDNSSNAPYDYTTAKYNGALSSNITDGSHQLAIGAMVGFRFKLGKCKTENKPAEEEVKEAVVVDNNKPQDEPKQENQQPAVEQTEQQPEQQEATDTKPEDIQLEPAPTDNGQVISISDIIGTNTGNKPADNQQTTEPKKDETKAYTEKGKQVVINGRTYTVVDSIKTIITFELNNTGNPDVTVIDQTIDDVATYLKQHPEYKLSIVGHTCDLGSDATNRRIGLARANTVKQDFIKRGIASSRLLTSTKASSQPLVPNTNDANRSKNRRVELEYVK
ncbi:MAG: OmpA family protein [Bacteroidales bacterium]|nr:OmpA family protein [Bacteroidales bacterium]